MPYPMAAVRNRNFGGAAAVPWWSVPSKTTLAAYQPIKAADYASSKINLANPGVYNAIDGAAYPLWSVDNGWYSDTTAIFRQLTNGLAFSINHTLVLRVWIDSISSTYRFSIGLPTYPASGSDIGLYSTGPTSVSPYHGGQAMDVTSYIATGAWYVMGICYSGGAMHIYRNGKSASNQTGYGGGSYSGNYNIFGCSNLRPYYRIAALTTINSPITLAEFTPLATKMLAL